MRIVVRGSAVQSVNQWLGVLCESAYATVVLGYDFRLCCVAELPGNALSRCRADGSRSDVSLAL
ncbi:hypothetical protein E2C01_048850 [Portunus trituberculatus]|uniref:Uncharacterized protein n=1 Tax=Portunus trituberculatus TaxID=210409 RepID=A0A5B7G4S5_PORTR|nr:hypothetical protein [Portunus trituberculatus]